MKTYRLFVRKRLYVSLFIVGLFTLAVSFPFVSGSMKQAFEASSAALFASVLTETKSDEIKDSASIAASNNLPATNPMLATTLAAGDIAIIGYNAGQGDNTGNPATVDSFSS